MSFLVWWRDWTFCSSASRLPESRRAAIARDRGQAEFGVDAPPKLAESFPV